jgi:hypothetical protein
MGQKTLKTAYLASILLDQETESCLDKAGLEERCCMPSKRPLLHPLDGDRLPHLAL